jgi:hypothetical protein
VLHLLSNSPVITRARWRRTAQQLAGEEFLVGLDRQRADAAGQQLAPVPGLCSTIAAGLARRLTNEQWRALEAGVAAVTERMLTLLPAGRSAALSQGPVTIDLDTTDVEVYGSKKRGVAFSANHQGQRVGRPHIWLLGRRPSRAGRRAGLRHRWSSRECGGSAGPRAGRFAAAGPARPDRPARGCWLLRRAARPRRPHRGHRLRDRRQAHRPAVAAARWHRRR